MSRIKEFYIKYLSWINAYWLVTIVFLIVTFTVGDSSLYKRYTYCLLYTSTPGMRMIEKEAVRIGGGMNQMCIRDSTLTFRQFTV